ncbi:MAG: DnaJ domain-containing protein [Phaeospirillum sp.]|nr:DnaJ domain-containing protein [Phaeospirillum sp.]
MLLRLILVAGALFGLWWGLRWLSKAPPAKAKKALIAGGLGLLVLTGVALVATGKLAGLFAVAAGLAPWIGRAMRLHGLWQGLQRMTGHSRPGMAEEPRPAPPDTAMTRQQAYEVLGLPPDATPDEIKEAHRRLMRANHPDSGGSTWIAARLNQARDLLLG